MKLQNLLCRFYSLGKYSIVAAFFIFLTLIGCQRTADNLITSDDFNTDAAKEWYYGVFKKSAQWANSALRGKKLPDWKNGLYKKIGNMEVVEFPLITARKQILILSSENILLSEKRRITEASLSKIAFIRSGNRVIDVRETYYIPTLSYLQDQRYDISHVSLLKADNNFTGQVVIKNWQGEIVSIKQMSNGKMFRSLKIKNELAEQSAVDQPNVFNNDCLGAEDIWECVFEEVCDVTVYAEGIEVEQCEWVNTGVCWPVECINDPDPCETMTEEECACRVYGICEDDGEDEPCEQTCISNFSSIPVFELISNQLGTPEYNSGTLIRKDQFNWYFNSSNLLGWTWKYKSFEKTESKKTNGIWKYTKVEHVSADWDGSLPPCTSTKITINNATPNIKDEGATARMDLAYKITMSVTCCPLCPDTHETGSSWAEWPCKQ